MRARIHITLLAAAAFTAGCGAHDEHSSGANSTDEAFVADMVPHHESAIEMARIAERRASHPEVKALASDIIEAQQSEIERMNAMGMHAEDGGHAMDMSAAEMGMDMDPADLETARPFDKAFLEMMIPHHEGAIRMAQAQLDKGDDPKLRELAEAIIAAQRGEIERMREWMTAWYG